MLTRTVISPSTIEKIRMDPATGKYMLHLLQNNGLLFINRDEREVLKKNLPLVIWKRLDKALSDGLIAWSPWIPDSEITRPEVALSETGTDSATGAISTPVEDYVDAAPVAKRNDLKSGDDACRNREEYWKLIVEPIVGSLSLRDRRVVMNDPYLFDHIHKADLAARGAPILSDLGLIWLLRELRNSTKTGSPMKVDLYTIEASDLNNDRIDLERINQLCEQYLAPIKSESFHIRVHVIRYWKQRNKNVELRDTYHPRKIFFNETRMLILDKGMEDLTNLFRGNDIPETRIDEPTFYLPQAGRLYLKFMGVIDKYYDVLWKDHPEYIITL
jgi:hypothetical protein